MRGGIYPAAPVYILRLFDIFGHGLTTMLQAQNYILLLGLFLIFQKIGSSTIKSTVSLLILLTFPTILGCMLVLWKDVTLSSLMVFSIALIYIADSSTISTRNFHMVKWASLLLIVVSTLIRFNAVTSTAILIVYWVLKFYGNRGLKTSLLKFTIIIAFIFFANFLLTSYSFPKLNKLPPNPMANVIMVNDLIGISKWSRTSLIPFDTENIKTINKASLEDIDRIYSSLGAVVMAENNKSLGGIVKTHPSYYTNIDIFKAWITAVVEYPMSYLAYRWDIFSEIIGAKPYRTFEPTHFNRIDENPFGITFHERETTTYILDYIKQTSGITYGKPWALFLLSIISTLFIVTQRSYQKEEQLLCIFSFISAVFYIAPFFFVSGTGEVRYTFPTIVLGYIPIVMFAFHVIQRYSSRISRINK